MNDDQQTEARELSLKLYQLCGGQKSRQNRNRKQSSGAASMKKKMIKKDMAEAAAALTANVVTQNPADSQPEVLVLGTGT